MHPARHTLAELAAALTAASGNLTRAADALGLSREALRTRLKRHPALRDALASARGRVRACPRCHGAGVIG